MAIPPNSEEALPGKLWIKFNRECLFSIYSPFPVCLAAGNLKIDTFRQYICQNVHFLKNKQHEFEAEKTSASSSEWDANGLIGLPGLSLGGKQKSFAEIFQPDMGHGHPVSQQPSRPASRNAFDENVDSLNNQSPSASQGIGAPSPYSYAAPGHC